MSSPSLKRNPSAESTPRRVFLQQLGGAALTAAAQTPASASQPTVPGPRAASRKLRIGIVGGRFGATFQWHLHPDCEVAAVCDLREDALNHLRRTYSCSHGYRHFSELLRHPGLDAVGIFTPAPLHAWMSIAALERDLHVISAVPAGMSEEELAQLLAAVKRSGRRYMMAETSRYFPEVMTCREWAAAGRFGSLFYAEAEYHHPGLLELMFDERGFPTWRHGFPPHPLLHALHRRGDPCPAGAPGGRAGGGMG